VTTFQAAHMPPKNNPPATALARHSPGRCGERTPTPNRRLVGRSTPLARPAGRAFHVVGLCRSRRRTAPIHLRCLKCRPPTWCQRRPAHGRFRETGDRLRMTDLAARRRMAGLGVGRSGVDCGWCRLRGREQEQAGACLLRMSPWREARGGFRC
jgi:hypothetical protein